MPPPNCNEKREDQNSACGSDVSRDIPVVGAFFCPRDCDGLDGPVVMAARKALETGNVNLVLIWVQKADEPEIRTAFQKTLAVRKLNSQARDLADMHFFETLVRIHRAGEGVAFHGSEARRA